MARHDQKPKKEHMTCLNCKMGRCVVCVDVTRYAAGFTSSICQCSRKDHSGEPRDQQILDPETGTVYAPELEVDIDGKVTRYMQEVEESKRAFNKGWDEARGMNADQREL